MNDVTLDRNDAESLILQEASSIEPGTNETSSEAPSPDEPYNITEDTTLILIFSGVVIILIVIVCLFYCKLRNQNKRALSKRDRRYRDRDRREQKNRRETPEGAVEQAVLPKSPSLASLQSTGSTYYDQLMGSGKVPKVQSISQYGALLAQHVPPK